MAVSILDYIKFLKLFSVEEHLPIKTLCVCVCVYKDGF